MKLKEENIKIADVIYNMRGNRYIMFRFYK